MLVPARSLVEDFLSPNGKEYEYADLNTAHEKHGKKMIWTKDVLTFITRPGGACILSLRSLYHGPRGRGTGQASAVVR